jgi:lipopolysaccharide assembly outer membrane protein LptD (OstA)
MPLTKKFLKPGFIFFFSLIFIPSVMALQEKALQQKQPITINGDTVEFKSGGGEVVAEGNVEIINQDTKLTCDKVRVFINEKLAIAEGHIKLVKPGVQELRGEMIIFDFGTQTGTIVSPEMRMPPYYAKAQSMERISDEEFSMSRAEISTCDLPHPHYLMKCKEIHMLPNNLLTAKGLSLSILDLPLMYMPVYTQELTDSRPRFMIAPGHKSDLGEYILGSWRYYLNENAKGLLHLDWYQKRGWAEGVDLNYDTKLFGLGNAKYYRVSDSGFNTNSSNIAVPLNEGQTKERSRIELRHRWDSATDHLVLDYFRSSDVLFRHDFFYNEYERETNPQSFFSWSHVFPMATLSFLEQPRVNKFDTMLEKLPEIRLETINQKISQTSFYFKSTTIASNLYNATANIGNTASVSRVDTSNQLSYVYRLMGLDFNPFVGHQDTYYSRGSTEKSALFREMFFTGMNVSTKLFKVYDVHSNVMHLDIDKLRHIVTPSIQYRYQPEPSIQISRLQQFDTTDSLDRENMVTFGLENRLQTKRNGESVDLITLLMTADYDIERNNTLGKGFQDLKYRLEFKPYSSWELDSDAEYDTSLKSFRNLNINFWMKTGKAMTVLGYNEGTGADGQITAGFTAPINPFWKLNIYERFDVVTGDLVEQQYILDRDLHCWTMEFIIDKTEANKGISFLIAFKVKAFPALGINATKTFSPPRSQ